MDEHATADRGASQPVSEPMSDASPTPRVRRVKLRHEAAVVASEIRRMQRMGWADAGRPEAAAG